MFSFFSEGIKKKKEKKSPIGWMEDFEIVGTMFKNHILNPKIMQLKRDTYWYQRIRALSYDIPRPHGLLSGSIKGRLYIDLRFKLEY